MKTVNSNLLKLLNIPEVKSDPVVETARKVETEDVLEVARSVIPEHRETASEKVERIRRELHEDRERRKAEYEKKPEVVKAKSRAEQLKQGFVKGRLRRGTDKEWVYFTIPEWTAMSVFDHMKYEVEVTNESANLHSFHSTGKTGKGRPTIRYSTLSGPRRF